MELSGFGFHAVRGLACDLLPTDPFGARKRQEDGGVGCEPSSGETIDGGYIVRGQAAAGALISKGGKLETICNDHRSFRERRNHHLIDEGGTRGQHEEELAPC